MMISYTCSLRIGKVTGLTWNNIILDDNEIGPHIKAVHQFQRVKSATLNDPIFKQDIICSFNNDCNTKTIPALVSLNTLDNRRFVLFSNELIYMFKKEKDYQVKMKIKLQDE